MTGSIRVIETRHFLKQWADRVGAYCPQIRRLILRSIEHGRARRHRREELGVLVPIEWMGIELCIVGIPGPKEFIIKTVMDRAMASRMGWNRGRADAGAAILPAA